MILPKVRDPRFITIRRGGTLTDAHHHLLAVWAADCAEHVLHLFEAEQPDDPRPRRTIASTRAWARGEMTMSQARAAAGRLECRWQREQLPAEIRELVIDDERLRNDICWHAFDC